MRNMEGDCGTTMTPSKFVPKAETQGQTGKTVELRWPERLVLVCDQVVRCSTDINCEMKTKVLGPFEIVSRPVGWAERDFVRNVVGSKTTPL